MSLQWFAADMRTGDVLAYLPSLDLGDGALQRIISTATTAQPILYLSGAPENWDRATKPVASWVACFEDTDPAKAILWAGYVNYRNPSAAADTLELTLITAEGMFDQRYVGDVTYLEGESRNDIAADILTVNTIQDHGRDHGIPFELDYVPGGGPELTADWVMQNSDNATVGVRLRQLFARLGGELTVEWAWGDSGQTSIVGTIRFGTRIGVKVAAGRKPEVQYQLPGQLLEFERPEDYTTGKAATKVVAYSTGSGDLVPYADPVYVSPADPDRPTVEYRYQPVPNTSPDGLTPYAVGAAKILGPGARVVKLTASLEVTTGRRYGTDWRLGDDIGYAVQPTDKSGRPILAFPGGVEGVGRAIGVEISPQANTITPVLAEATIYVESDS